MGKESQQNGLTTKPHSIYDYPEHLNPFYQDENHKRLRFWALKKEKGSGKSNSFSMSNLRDLWAFKTFSLKKKSSTLGINKTSESPPPLRKYGTECLYDSNYNTYDPRYRQTIGTGGGSTTDVAFERNAPYRATVTGTMNPSSAKNYDTQSDIVFNRHESYRHTIQNVGKTRNNQASVTPVLNQRRMQSSVSQSSLRSTNPFDDDYENNENTSPNQQDTIIENGGVLRGSARRPYKKKRRAPPPPIVHQYVPVLPQESCASNNLRIDEVELKIVEEETPSRQETPARDDDLATIRMITAEIETLYKDLEKEEEKLKISEEAAAQKVVKESEIAEKVEKKVETEKNFVKEEKHEEPVVIVDRVEVVQLQRAEQPTIETRAETPKPEMKPKPVVAEVEITQEIVTQTNAIEMRIHEEKEEVVIEPHVTFNEVNDVHIIREPSVVSSVTTNQSTEPSPEREPEQQLEILQVQTKSYHIDEPLMIVETPKNRDLDEPVPSTFPRRSEGSVTAFEIKYKQLKDGPDSRFMLQRRRSLKEKERKEFMQRALNLDRSQSVDIRRNLDEEFEIYNHYHNGHANGDKRRSVKEIIESINRNQSLLQATNYTPLNGKYDYNNVATSQNSQKPVIPPKPIITTTKIDEQIVELRNPQSQNGRGSYYDNVPEILEQLEEQASTFQKCKTPPRKDFDWNPVPKPRRSRNFSEEREIPRNEGLKEYY